MVGAKLMNFCENSKWKNLTGHQYNELQSPTKKLLTFEGTDGFDEDTPETLELLFANTEHLGKLLA